MVLIATALIVVGSICALLGQKIFTLLLPLVGFFVGLMVGFSGVQAVLGTGAVSLSIAIIMALIVGVVMAVLSYLFIDIAIAILIGIVGASAFTFLGVALGLAEQGFIVTLLGIAGFVLGIIVATGKSFSQRFIMAATAFVGVGYVLAGSMLLVGDLSATDLHSGGILKAVTETVDQSFLWFFAWLGGTLVAMNIQATRALQDAMSDQFVYKPSKK